MRNFFSQRQYTEKCCVCQEWMLVVIRNSSLQQAENLGKETLPVMVQSPFWGNDQIPGSLSAAVQVKMQGLI